MNRNYPHYVCKQTMRLHLTGEPPPCFSRLLSRRRSQAAKQELTRQRSTVGSTFMLIIDLNCEDEDNGRWRIQIFSGLLKWPLIVYCLKKINYQSEKHCN